MNNLKPIMFVGTGSDVGKSVITAAFCRIFKQDGYNPAPFKAQNMSLNSYSTPDELEIGRAQAMQAEACGLDCSVDMNPVLLKPLNNNTSQVVLNGKPIGNKTATDYFNHTDRDKLFTEAINAYNRLAINHNPMVIEGAGSISEINLWDKDITNMRVANQVGAAVFLVADIDKGGVFASVYGTIQLLPERERNLVKGIIINKFRGDKSLFSDGCKILEKLTGKPVVGVIPWFTDIYIEDEDSVVLSLKKKENCTGKINIAVVLLQHISNFTDFNYLERIPEVNLYYADNHIGIEKADIIIIPGTKNTISDLQNLRNTGQAKAILNAHRAGKPVYGICGGFQMMGKQIYDPLHNEGTIETIPGLGILPIETTITESKIVKQQQFQFLDYQEVCAGYEIHKGETTSTVESPLCQLPDNKADGYFLNPKTWGTYIHGIFDNQVVINYILKLVKQIEVTQLPDIKIFKNEQYNKLAKLVRDNVDINYIYNSLKI